MRQNKSFIKVFYFLSFICLLNISCRTDSDIVDVPGQQYMPPLEIYKIISPSAGEIWNPGGVGVIKWVSSDNSKPVDIFIIKKKAYFETVVVKNLPNTGVYTWDIPSDIPLSHHYQVRISESAKTGNISYSEVFFIK